MDFSAHLRHARETVSHTRTSRVAKDAAERPLNPGLLGEVAERLNALVLKTRVRDERTEGSNPSLS
jgi:hypothetical protein